MLQIVTAVLVGFGVLSTVPVQEKSQAKGDVGSKPALTTLTGKLQSVWGDFSCLPPQLQKDTKGQLLGYQLVDDNGKVWELYLGSRTAWRLAKQHDGKRVEVDVLIAKGKTTIEVMDIREAKKAGRFEEINNFTRSLIGKSKAEAMKWAESQGLKIRIAYEDGVSYPLTMDLRTDRINLSIENGKVIGARIG